MRDPGRADRGGSSLSVNRQKIRRIAGWGSLALLIGGLGLAGWLTDRVNHRRIEEKAASEMARQEKYLRSVAFDLLNRSCKMLVWISLEHPKGNKPLPGPLVLADGSMPWEPSWNDDSNIAELLQFVAQPHTPEMFEFQERVWTLRNADSGLKLAASDLLTAMTALQSDSVGTAEKKFEDARRHTNEAIADASKAYGDQDQGCGALN